MGIVPVDGGNDDFATFEKANQPTKVDEIPVGKIKP
jgi:hypothetical protein